MPLNILIVGAGVCGPALAILLQGSEPRHNITVVERSPSLRLAGQQLDLKSQGIPITKKMGILDTIKSHCVKETGVELVYPNGKPVAQFGVNESGKRQITLTSEYEIMRGDLVNVFYEASLNQRAKLERDGTKKGGLTYEFEKTIVELTQDNDGADVTFSDGQERRYDLVVGADGQGSKTRRLAFGQEASDEVFKSIGIHAAYYSIPRVEGEGELARAYHAAGSRMVMTRTGDRSKTQVYLFIMKDTERLKTLYKEPMKKQKEIWTEMFKDAGWQSERLLGGLDTCDDFYAHELGQVKMPELHKGRVVLLGDAGYCPSAFTGLGTTLSLIGAYVLAGELAKHESVDSALKAYDEVMRPPIKECQFMPFGMLRVFLPSSELGIWILRNTMWTLSNFGIIQMIQRLLPEDKGGWRIPEYPELKLGS